MTKPNEFDAIQSLAPGAKFSYGHGGSNIVETGDKLVWNSPDINQPTDSAIATEKARLQTEYDAKKYQRDRAAEYPLIVDQLDDIYHNGIDAWKATIKKTKDKYPKS